MLRLRDYQQECIDALYVWFQNNIGNPLLVLPTGSGKSLIAARICEDALSWPNQRVLILTHVRELVEQNYVQLFRLWPEAPSGIYCAGLDRKQAHHPITFASIQSVYKKANELNWRDLVIIDEAHLLSDSDSGMYRQLLAGLRSINPDLRVIGLSATPYRTKSGYLHKGENALFNDIAFEMPIGRLVKEGYLARLDSKAANTQGDTNKLSIQAGEFALREAITEFDREEMTGAAVEEMLAKGANRKSWLIFCVSIEHAEHIRDALRERYIDTEMVCDKTPDNERSRILEDLKAGRLRAVTNVSVLTTGFDAPNIDLLVFLRPTMSPGLLVQMCGRGMRPVYRPGHDLSTAEGRLSAIAAGPKPDCLVLDMASNLERHGPITHIQPPVGGRRDKKEREGKICPKCRTVNVITATDCLDCGHIFEGKPRTIKHNMKASTANAMSSEPVIGDAPVWLNVKFINYSIHTKIDSPPSLKVMYKTDAQWAMEWLPFAHPKNYPRERAQGWWFARGGLRPAPTSAQEAISRLKEIQKVWTKAIKVKKEGKFQTITQYELVSRETLLLGDTGNLGNSLTQTEKLDEQTIAV